MLKKVIKACIPRVISKALRRCQKYLVYNYRRILILIPISQNKRIKVIFGAALTSQKGWYSTNEQWLDISSSSDWDNLFKNKILIESAIAEHVFEHLTRDEMKCALTLIIKHMVVGGRLRIAVPDGYNPDPVYIKNVGINGIGADAQDHKQILNFDYLKQVMEETGFEVYLREGYLSNGKLVINSINDEHGRIIRSRSNKENMARKEG